VNGERSHVPFTMPCEHCGGCRVMLFAGVTLLAVLCLHCDMPDDDPVGGVL